MGGFRVIIGMMSIVQAPGCELGLRVHGVEQTATLGREHCIVRYNGRVTVAGIRFNISINFGDNTNGIWCPNKVWVMATPDQSDPAVKEALQRATVQALKAGFNSVRREQNNYRCFECPVCRRNRAFVDRFRKALLLPDNADVTMRSCITVAARAGRGRGGGAERYDLCLFHGDQIFLDEGVPDDSS